MMGSVEAAGEPPESGDPLESGEAPESAEPPGSPEPHESPGPPAPSEPPEPPTPPVPPVPPAPPEVPPPDAHGPDDPVFDTQNILWHFGALSATVAALVFVGQVHSSARGFWVLLVSLVFVGAYAGGAALLLRAGRRIPGGIVAAAAVSFVPLTGEAFERLSPRARLEPWRRDPGVLVGRGDGRFRGGHREQVRRTDMFALAVATACGRLQLIVYALVRYAFVFAWVAVATLFAAELLLPLVVSRPGTSDRADTLLATGLVFLGVGLYADLVHARRIAFWWHLVGLMAITGAFVYHLTVASSPGWVVALIAGVAALALAAPMHRATWALFGLLGMWAPIVHYSARWFGNLGTAFALFVIGLSILGAGLAVQRAGDSWAAALARRARHA